MWADTMMAPDDGFRLYIAVDEKGNLGKSLRGERHYTIVGSMIVNREAFESISRHYSVIRGREIKYHDDPDLREKIVRRAAPYVEEVYFVKYHKDPRFHNTHDGLPAEQKADIHIQMLHAIADKMIAEAGLAPMDVDVDYNKLVRGRDVPSIFECSPSGDGKKIKCSVQNSKENYGLMTNDFIVGAVGDFVSNPGDVDARRLLGFLRKKPREVYLRNRNKKAKKLLGFLRKKPREVYLRNYGGWSG